MNLTFNQKLAIAVAVLGVIAAGSTQLSDILAPFMDPNAATAITKSITALCALVGAALASVLAMFTGQQNLIKDVARLASDPKSPIQGVITTNTPEGVRVASQITGGQIAPAGTTQATEMAKP